MSASPRRRWLLLSVLLAALAGLTLWRASGSVAERLLERQLHAAGWPDARVDGGAWFWSDVAFDRVRLTADGSLVAEDVRARLRRGIEHVAIRRLLVDAELGAGGEWVWPGNPASSGDGSLPLDTLPPDGIAVGRVGLRATTPLGTARVILADVTARPDDARRGASIGFRIDGGELDARGVRMAGLTGAASATLVSDTVSFEIAAEADSVDAVGIALGPVTVTASGRDGRARFTVRAPAGNAANVSIDGETTFTATERTASLVGSVELGPAAPARGRIDFEAELEGLDADAAGRVRGRVELEGRALEYPGYFGAGVLAVAGEIDGSRDELRVTLDDARAELVPERSVVPGFAASLGGEPVTLQLVEAGGRAPLLRWAIARDEVELVGRLTARAGAARAALTLDARAAGIEPSRSSGAELGADFTDLTAQNVPWGDLVVGVDDFDGSLVRGEREWRLAGTGTLRAAGEVSTARLDDVVVDVRGRVAGAPERIVLTVDQCVRVRAGAIAIGAMRLAEVTPVCISGGDGGVLLTHDVGTDRTAFTLTLDEQPLRARLTTDGGATRSLDGRWPRLAAAGTIDASATTFSARFSGGAMTLPEARLAASGFDGSAEVQNGALVSAALEIARLESLLSPAPIVPVGIELTAERIGDGLAFDAIASDALGTFVLEAAGRYEHERATARVRLHPVRFVSGATEVPDLSPFLAEHIANASGVVELEGDVEWVRGALTGRGTLSTRDFAATVAGIAVAGVNTETRFANLFPPATEPGQTVTIARVDLGVPLEHGTAVFDLGADGVLAFRRVEFGFAGGRVYAEPFTIDSASLDDIGIVLRAEDVELSQLLALGRIEGLAGTGVLSGRVPVRLIDGGIRLDDGVLAAETDGVLRYTPNDLPDFLRGDDVRSRMLREVLTNFRYDELSVAVSGESRDGGEQTLTLSARGANPDFLDGHPIELKFNFRGPLLGALRSAVDLTGAAELEQIFEQRGTENEENSR